MRVAGACAEGFAPGLATSVRSLARPDFEPVGLVEEKDAMATLTVTGADTDYRDGSPTIPANTDEIVFSTSAATTARFFSSQFGGSGISVSVAITGDGQANTIAVHMDEATFSAANWTFPTWSAADEVRFFGTDDPDQITGSIQRNSFTGEGGADVLLGGNQGDTFIYSSPSDVVTGEILDGNGGTDQIIIVASGIDLSLAVILEVEQIALFASAILDGDQIGSGAINEVIGFAGNPATLTVNGSSTDLSGVTFTDWNVAIHSVVVNGTGGADDLTGSSQNDTITGGLGADTMAGGNGNDTFVYSSDTEIVAGETIDGGGGTGDRLRIATADSYDFRIMAAPGGIEQLEFAASDGSTARFNSSQFGGAGMSDSLAITGDANGNTVAVHTLSDTFFSAAGWTFTNWSANDNVLVFGTVDAETITGSSQKNTITGGGGADILTGGGLADTFIINSGSDLIAGETINGLGGTDTVRLSTGGNFDLSGVSLTSIEMLFVGGTATLNGGQIGAGAITSVDAGLFSNLQGLTVNGATVNLSAVTFTGWTPGVETITINGTAGNDSLTGSNQRDTLSGGGNNDILNGGAEADTLNGEAGNDTLDGGAGLDVLNGGLGDDTYVMGAENDTVTDTGGTDTITSTISRSLADFASIENLTLLESVLTGTGNGLANVITGNGLANTLDGGDGADALLGGDGADSLLGGAANDRLIGGLGADQFTGGTEADTFAFLTLADSGKKKSARDTVLDFGIDDFIDLAAIDAKTGGKDNKFKFIGKQDFHKKKGELHFEKKKGDVIVSGDVDGNGKADFAVLLDNVNKVAKGDFVL